MLPMLKVEHLTKVYGSGKRALHALGDVSFEASAHEILGLLGPNGAGKTTTIKTICGLILPTSGHVYVDGENIAQKRAAAPRVVGAVLEGSRNLYWQLTPLENLEYFGALRGVPRAVCRQRARDLLGLFDLYDRRNATVNGLSRGMQQKLAIAVALIHDPRLLLLDEPTLGLDFTAAAKVKEQVKRLSEEQGKTIVLTSHQLEVVRDLCGQLIILDRGHLVAQGELTGLVSALEQLQLEIIVRGALPVECCRALAQITGARVTVQAVNGTSHIQALVQEPAALYPLLDTLKPRPIVSIRETEDSLGRAILQCAASGDKARLN